MAATFAVVDDDLASQRMLADILNTRGDVIAEFSSGQEALKYFESGHRVDVCFIDLLMPDISGIEVVENVLSLYPGTLFVMISQVEAKTLLAKAYTVGVEFFIHKPINRKEILAIADRVLEKQRLKSALNLIEKSLAEIHNPKPLKVKKTDEAMIKKRFQLVFADLGILGETGSRELQAIVLRFRDSEEELLNLPLRSVYQAIAGSEEEIQSIEQRIRRVIKQALGNIALRGSEDFYDECFERYASKYFDYAEVRDRVLELRQKRTSSARINIRKFIIALYMDVLHDI
ncbi:response regulator with CheY-like receiver, AAA-type ATPase, and DNA-binding domains [Desulfosporosinus acidiphilus SJ4]|uniref:Stage 0 sporulation protein A homolog n=1 Tax=Desulfosporosinus acidiphilus (strain DSM 22704 / JCM 16185 / SJ4) TaxID=646529 RepID=I4D605_DESAJ|nr:response regulator [Desulfosporosinus acidiphilus]AFM41229.1 response regulator with CheY-like receiver, AAA-type ATPase, and DNA-binding domains [Desulfosporosinus acidiphilus SJ4]